MKVGVIGSGNVGQTLAAGFVKQGHTVMVGTRDPAKLKDWLEANPDVRVEDFNDTAAFAEVVVLAVKGSVAAAALHKAGKKNLEGKLVIDACNPIADAPPVNGVLQFFTTINASLMEQLQKEFPGAHFVKAFNSVGAPRMVNPEYKGGVRPTMFICGNDDGAKVTTTKILDEFGWETADMGKVEAARAIEPLCMLWCILGFTKNEWTHAFKLLRQ
ncbi:MAG: NAD(P)-binding domain-containing protein [Terracidiphilus sp.]|jgi:predicted dinucleotide-binding enzyme